MVKYLYLCAVLTSLAIPTDNSRASKKMIRVMSYNLRLDTPVDSINQWPYRTDKVVALIKKYNPDIIGIQEALHHQLQDLLHNLPEYSYCGVGRDDGKEAGEYSAILYRTKRFKLLETKTQWLSETMDQPGSKSWDAAITRIFTSARFLDRKSRKRFLMVNTHFDHIGKSARENSSKLIKTYLAELKKKRKRIGAIVSGDFNSEPSEEAYLTIINEQDKFSLLDSKPAGSNAATFYGFKVGEIPGKTIDYIFHTKEWAVKSYQVIEDNDGTYYPSDHLPVLVDFYQLKPVRKSSSNSSLSIENSSASK